MKIKWTMKGQSVVVSNDFTSSPNGGKFENYSLCLNNISEYFSGTKKKLNSRFFGHQHTSTLAAVVL
jgi:hypothetical protein